MGIFYSAILLLISFISVSVGLFLFLKPLLAIEIQKRFYARINWRIEPISLSKELHNTRVMGLFLVQLTLCLFIYYLVAAK